MRDINKKVNDLLNFEEDLPVLEEATLGGPTLQTRRTGPPAPDVEFEQAHPSVDDVIERAQWAANERKEEFAIWKVAADIHDANTVRYLGLPVSKGKPEQYASASIVDYVYPSKTKPAFQPGGHPVQFEDLVDGLMRGTKLIEERKRGRSR